MTVNPIRAERPLTVYCSGPAALSPSFEKPPLQAGIVQLWFCRLEDARDRLALHAGWLDHEEQARAERFRFDHDRERFITAHGLLRKVLAHELDLPPDRVMLNKGPHGKPFVNDARLRFNMSDTKDAVLIAVTLEREIGADLETMDRRVDHTAVADHFFTPEEIRWIGADRSDPASAPDAKRRFLTLWTRKEAVLKASGVGIMEDLRSLRSDAAVNRMVIRHPEFVTMAAQEYHVHTHHLGDTHILSVAADMPWRELHLLRA